MLMCPCIFPLTTSYPLRIHKTKLCSIPLFDLFLFIIPFLDKSVGVIDLYDLVVLSYELAVGILHVSIYMPLGGYLIITHVVFVLTPHCLPVCHIA